MERKSRRSLRVAMVLGAAVAGTALVGFGGLAAWNAYTENAGNSVAAGTLAHANNGLSCVSSLGSVPVSSGTGWCSAVISLLNTGGANTGADPANGKLPISGTVKIDNTGTLASTFSLSMAAGSPTPGASTICQDLTLTVTSLPSTTAVYGPLPLSTAITGTALNNDAPTPVPSWTGGGIAGTGTGATGNTFTFTVAALATNFAADYADAGANCTFNLLFTQTAA
jgi:hypothetical protein